MLLTVALKSEKEEILAQEEPILTATVKNVGDQKLRIPHPGFDPVRPALRVVNLVTGAEDLHAPRRPTPGTERPVDLEAGKELRCYFLLRQRMKEGLPPGEYEVSAVYEYEQGRLRGESVPVRLKVHPVLPANLALDTVQGSVLWGAWVNMAGAAPALAISRFDLLPGGGVRGTRTVAGAGVRCRPVLSLPPNRRGRQRPWVAWLEGRSLHFVHVDPKQGPSPVGEADGGAAESEILGPLCAEATQDTRKGPEATALLWEPSLLRAVHLSTKGTRPGMRFQFPGPKPKWAMNFIGMKGDRVLVFVRAEGDKLSLSALPWSDNSFGSVRTLAEWNGEYVGAGATLGLEEEVIRGAVVMRRKVDGKPAVQAVPWQSGKEFRAEEFQDTGWKGSEPIERALVRVSRLGTRAYLFQGSGREWSLSAGRGFSPLPMPWRKSTVPIEVGFMGGYKAVLICAEEGAGFRVLLPDGKPLSAPM